MTSHDSQSVSQSTIHLVKQTNNLSSQQTDQPDIQPSSHPNNLRVSQLATKAKRTAENKVCKSNQNQEKKVKQSKVVNVTKQKGKVKTKSRKKLNKQNKSKTKQTKPKQSIHKPSNKRKGYQKVAKIKVK